MAQVTFMFTVTTQPLAGVGLCSRRDWMALSASIATGAVTNMALVTQVASFGSDWKIYAV